MGDAEEPFATRLSYSSNAMPPNSSVVVRPNVLSSACPTRWGGIGNPSLYRSGTEEKKLPTPSPLSRVEGGERCFPFRCGMDWTSVVRFSGCRRSPPEEEEEEEVGMDHRSGSDSPRFIRWEGGTPPAPSPPPPPRPLRHSASLRRGSLPSRASLCFSFLLLSASPTCMTLDRPLGRGRRPSSTPSRGIRGDWAARKASMGCSTPPPHRFEDGEGEEEKEERGIE